MLGQIRRCGGVSGSRAAKLRIGRGRAPYRRRSVRVVFILCARGGGVVLGAIKKIFCITVLVMRFRNILCAQTCVKRGNREGEN
jgi:hypothetical protein